MGHDGKALPRSLAAGNYTVSAVGGHDVGTKRAGRKMEDDFLF